MIPIASPTATVQGVTYELKPFSAKNYEILRDKGNSFRKRYEANELDQFEYWDAMLRLIFSGEPEWDVTADDFDGREAENAILAFLPPSMQVSLLLTGFQPA